MTGLGSACSHVAALLFKIKSVCLWKLTEVISPTSVFCEWKKSKKAVQPDLKRLSILVVQESIN